MKTTAISLLGGILLLSGCSSLNRTDQNAAKFEGVIAAWDDPCFIPDAPCRIRIDDKWVIYAKGGVPMPTKTQESHGQTVGFYRTRKDIMLQQIGKHVEAYVGKEGDHFTLYGSNDYYIKLLDNE